MHTRPVNRPGNPFIHCCLLPIAALLVFLTIGGCARNETGENASNESPNKSGKSTRQEPEAVTPSGNGSSTTRQTSASQTSTPNTPGKTAGSGSGSDSEETIPANKNVSPAKTATVANPDDKKILGNAKLEVERLFGDWKKPDVVLFLTGRQHGYIEPCGCTGLANQKGGLLRRHTFSKTLESRGWELVKIDAGNQVRRFGPQPEIKFATTARTLADIFHYDAIAFGRDDLRLPAIELVSTMQNLEGVDENPTHHPFVSCNVTLFSDFTDPSFEDDKIMSTYKVVESNGRKIAITAILGEEHFDAVRNDDLCLRTPDEGIESVWEKMKAENADIHVLVAHTSIDDTNRLAKKYPYFDIVITAGGAGEPTLKPDLIESGKHVSRVVQVGTKGMYAGIVGYYAESNDFQYKRVDLSAAFEDSEEIKQVFKDYQAQVERKIFARLKDNMVPHPSGAEYVGSEKCAECHADAFDVWKEGIESLGDDFGPHSHATASLLEPNERNWVIRKFDPECLSCHVTGWNPQKYFPYKTGYLDETNVHLHGNGCENCHGPGSLHVTAQENEENVEQYQKMVRLTLKDAEQKCQECHDLDNSPDFHVKGAFEKYWKRIDHSGLLE